MNAVLRETRFLLRDRGALLWIALAFLLSAAATGFGVAEVREQRATIAEYYQRCFDVDLMAAA